MKKYPLSYQVNTVYFDGKRVRKLPEETYENTLSILKSLGITEVMLSGYVMVEEADFDMDDETKRVGNLLDSLEMKPAQHHGLAAVYAPLENSQDPVIEKLIREVQYTANLHSPVLVIHPSQYYEPDSWSRHVGNPVPHKNSPLHAVLPIPFSYLIHSRVQPGVFIMESPVKKLILIMAFWADLACMDPHLADGRMIPQAVKQAPGRLIDFQGGICSRNQGGLTGSMAKFPVRDGNTHAGSFHAVSPQPGAHGFRKG